MKHLELTLPDYSVDTEPDHKAVGKPVDNLLKKYRSLFFDGKRATILHQSQTHEVIKMRLDTETRSMSGKLRLVFIAVISDGAVTFIELYAKNVKNREDQQRIQKYLG